LKFLPRPASPIFPLLLLAGCASVFDAPYVEAEELPVALSVLDVESEPEMQVREVLAEIKVYPDIWARIRDGFKLDVVDGDQSRVVPPATANGLSRLG